MSMQLIQRVSVPSTQALIEFSSIPSGFTDLLLVVSARIDGSGFAAVWDDGRLLINGTASTTISYRHLFGEGSGSGISDTFDSRLPFGNSQSTANTFGNLQIYIPNYRSATNKSFSVEGVSENNGTAARQVFSAGLWNNTSAITSLTLDGAYGNFVAGSTATLYGITAGTLPGVTVS